MIYTAKKIEDTSNDKKIESLIGEQCAPALAGIKPANIVSCKKELFFDIHKKVESLNRDLNRTDIKIEIICECEKSVLLIVYREKVLNQQLQNRLNKAFLYSYGYQGAESIEDYIEILKTRLKCDSFPHEIGVFLGYPLHDVYCFIHHRDEGCLLVGDWRVYHNAENAAKLFGRFKACKKAVAKKVAEGRSLAQIFCAA